MAVSRSALLVAGSDEVGPLNAMAAFAEQLMLDEVRPIAYTPLILHEGAWKPFEPKAAELAPLRVLSAKQRLWDYSAQTPLLQKQLDRVGEDWFVAPLESVFDDAELRTWTSWTKAVPTKLPRADAVGLTAGEGEVIVRRWVDVEAVCSPFPIEEGAYPLRFRAEGWPSAEAWARLKAHFPPPTWFPG